MKILVSDHREYEDEFASVSEMQWNKRHGCEYENSTRYDKEECRVHFVATDDDFHEDIYSHEEANEFLKLAKENPSKLNEEIFEDGQQIESVTLWNLLNDWNGEWKICESCSY